jgi:hypothetical protein
VDTRFGAALDLDFAAIDAAPDDGALIFRVVGCFAVFLLECCFAPISLVEFLVSQMTWKKRKSHHSGNP